MAKIGDYPKVSTLAKSNIMLLDRADGTKGIFAGDLAKSLLSLMTTNEIMSGVNIGDLEKTTGWGLDAYNNYLIIGAADGYKKMSLSDAAFGLLDLVIDAPTRNSIVRGKNLGSEVSATQYDNIANGTFRGMFLGDFWKIGNTVWRLVDFDYWYGRGSAVCGTHHVVIMPDRGWYSEGMGGIAGDDDMGITYGAYAKSYMYKEGLNEAKKRINNIFTEAHVLNHREFLQNATTNGYASGGAWFDSTVEIPNEPMIFGSYIFTPANNGSTSVSRTTISHTSLALLRLCPQLIPSYGDTYWLRDVVSKDHYACVDRSGCPSFASPIVQNVVRPVFGICKANS